MPTAGSGDTPYATVDQFVNFHDERSVRQLLSDDDVPLTGSLSDNEKLRSLLKAASGKVEAAATAGRRYVIDPGPPPRNDLELLNGNSAELLAQLVCDLAFFRLWLRRPNVGVKLPPQCEEAEEFLERLRLGERIFGIVENAKAASVQAPVESAADVANRRGIVVEADRYFGIRNNRLSRP